MNSKIEKLLSLYLLLDSDSSDDEVEDEIVLSVRSRKRRHIMFQNRNEEGVYVCSLI